MATNKRYTFSQYAKLMGVSKQRISKLVSDGLLQTIFSREVGKILVLDTIENRVFFDNPSPLRKKRSKI